MASDFYDLNVNIFGRFQNAAEVKRQLQDFSAPINVKINANIDALRNLARPQTATVNVVVRDRQLLTPLENQIARIAGLSRIRIELDTPAVNAARQKLNQLNDDVLRLTSRITGLGRVDAIRNLGTAFSTAAGRVTQTRDSLASTERALDGVRQAAARTRAEIAQLNQAQNQALGSNAPASQIAQRQLRIQALEARRAQQAAEIVSLRSDQQGYRRIIPGQLTASDRAASAYFRGSQGINQVVANQQEAIRRLTAKGLLGGTDGGLILDPLGRPINPNGAQGRLIERTQRTLGLQNAASGIAASRRQNRISSFLDGSEVYTLPEIAAHQTRLKAEEARVRQAIDRSVRNGNNNPNFETHQENLAKELEAIIGGQTANVRKTRKRQLALDDLGTPVERERLAKEEANFAKTQGEVNRIGRKYDVQGLTRGRTFELGRLTKPDTSIQLGFALAYGGIPSAIGAAIGGSSRLGSGGAVLGSTITQAVIGGIVDPLKEAFHVISEEIKGAGLAFERSILGISSIGLANTTFVGSSGQSLPVGQQLNLQSKRAQEIQLKSRAKLLPQGIAGQTESTFVQGVVSALSQRGLNPTADQVAEISSLLGGAIQTQRPGLLDNTQLLLRDVQDVLGGGPQASRTILSQLIRPALGGLKSARSAEDIVSALKAGGLGAFREAATKSDNPAALFQRLEGSVDLLKTNAGIKFLDALTPSLKKLLDTLNSESDSGKKITKAAEDIGKAFGDIAGAFVSLQTAAIKALPSLINLVDKLKEAGGQASDLGPEGLALVGAAGAAGVLSIPTIGAAGAGLAGLVAGGGSLELLGAVIIPAIPIIVAATLPLVFAALVGGAIGLAPIAIHNAAENKANREQNDLADKTNAGFKAQADKRRTEAATLKILPDTLLGGLAKIGGIDLDAQNLEDESNPTHRLRLLNESLTKDFGGVGRIGPVAPNRLISGNSSDADIIAAFTREAGATGQGGISSKLLGTLTGRHNLEIAARAEQQGRLDQLSPFTGDLASKKFGSETSSLIAKNTSTEIANIQAIQAAQVAFAASPERVEGSLKLYKETQKKVEEKKKEIASLSQGREPDQISARDTANGELSGLYKTLEGIQHQLANPLESITNFSDKLNKLNADLKVESLVAQFGKLDVALQQITESFDQQIRVLDDITPGGIRGKAGLGLTAALSSIPNLQEQVGLLSPDQRPGSAKARSLDETISRLPSLTLNDINSASAHNDFIKDLLPADEAAENNLAGITAKLTEAENQLATARTGAARVVAGREVLSLREQHQAATNDYFDAGKKVLDNNDKYRSAQDQLQKQINQETEQRSVLNQKLKDSTVVLSDFGDKLETERLGKTLNILGQAQSFTQLYGRLPENTPTEVTGALFNPGQKSDLEQKYAEAQITAATREYDRFVASGQTQEEALRDEISKNITALDELTNAIHGLRDQQTKNGTDFFPSDISDPKFGVTADSVATFLDNAEKIRGTDYTGSGSNTVGATIPAISPFDDPNTNPNLFGIHPALPISKTPREKKALGLIDGLPFTSLKGAGAIDGAPLTSLNPEPQSIEERLKGKSDKQNSLGENLKSYSEKLQKGVKEGKITAEGAKKAETDAQKITLLEQMLLEMQKGNDGALEKQFSNALQREMGGGG